MKTVEELNALKEELAALKSKVAELTDKELEEVAGGTSPEIEREMWLGPLNETTIFRFSSNNEM